MRAREQGWRKPDLTDGILDDVFSVTVPDDSVSAAEFEFELVVDDGTDQQTIYGEGWWNLFKKTAGALTGNLNISILDVQVSAGTLTATGWVMAVAGDVATLRVNANTSLGVPVAMDLRIKQRGPAKITPL